MIVLISFCYVLQKAFYIDLYLCCYYILYSKKKIRDKYTKNCFSDGVKTAPKSLKECVSKRLGPFLPYVSGRIDFCIILSIIFAPARNVV